MSEDQNLRTPTSKNPVINAVLSELAGKDRITTIRAGGCMTCSNHPDQMTNEDFRDLLSVKEYGISGMCQECQDSVFT